jgi:hypothetical protein
MAESLGAVRSRAFYLFECYGKCTFLREGGAGTQPPPFNQALLKRKAYLFFKKVYYIYFIKRYIYMFPWWAWVSGIPPMLRLGTPPN